MKKIIHNLRQKPEEERRHILHISVFVIGLLLFATWVYTLGTGLTETKQAQMKKDIEPFSAMTQSFINGYDSLGE